MEKNVTIYKANKFYASLILIVPLILLVPLFEGGTQIEDGKLIGYCILSFLAIILALTPFAARLEIDQDSVKSYFLNFRVSDLCASDVQVVEYGNLFRGGGIGGGKGLNIRVKKGLSKTYSVGEKLYGTEAIIHAYKVLSSGKVLIIDAKKAKETDRTMLIGSIGMAASMGLFFLGFLIPDTFPSFLKFIFPISMFSLISFIVYTIAKSAKS
jgi:hypothetical protein